MAAIYVALQIIAIGLLTVNCWIPALIVAGVALMVAFRGPIRNAWGAMTPLRAPRPASTDGA